MKIALDYDDTYTADPLMWNWFVEQAEARGHEVFCVTARHGSMLEEVEFTLGRHLRPDHIISCFNEPKRKVCAERGVMIDVWIDDKPEMVVEMPLLRGL